MRLVDTDDEPDYHFTTTAEIVDPVDRPVPEFIARLRDFVALNTDDETCPSELLAPFQTMFDDYATILMALDFARRPIAEQHDPKRACRGAAYALVSVKVGYVNQ